MNIKSIQSCLGRVCNRLSGVTVFNKLTLAAARRDKLFAAVALAGVTSMLFCPVLFGGRTLLGVDFMGWFYGIKVFYRESVLTGDFPFWCPYTMAGTPLLAGLQHALVYPLSVVWIVFPAAYAYGVFATLHLWLFAWFTYLLARECRTGVAGAWVAACGAMCAGIMIIGNWGCTEHIAGMTWLPLILYFYFGVLRDGGWKKITGLAAAGALMVYSGSPYPLLMAMVALAVAGGPFWWRLENRPRLMVVLARGMAAAALAFLLAAPQLLPTLELARQVPSEFLVPNPVEQAQHALLPSEWARMLVPAIYGLPAGHHLGILTVLLCATAMVLLLSRRLQWNAALAALVALAAAGVVMASGPLFGLHRVLALAPMVSRLYKEPGMFIFITAMVLPVVAGLVVRPLRRLPRTALWWLAGVSLLAALLVLFAEPWLELWTETARKLPRYMHDLKSSTAQPDAFPVLPAVNQFLVLWMCSLGAALLLAGASRRRLALAVATALLFTDAALLVRDLRLFGATNVYETETPSMRALREAGAGRELARVHKTYHMMGEMHIVIGSNNPREFAWVRDFLPCSVSVPWHFYLTNGSGTLNPPETQYVWSLLLDRFEPWQNDRLRGLWNAKWIMDIQRDTRGYSYRLRENPQFMPRAWLTARALPVDDWQTALRLLLNKDFDTRGTALLYATPTEVPEKLQRHTGKFTAATSVTQTNNTITVRATADDDAVLVVADTYYKWWRAEIDGLPTRVFKVNMSQKAVLFPAGEHTVRLVCVPVSFWTGCGLFAIGMSLAAWLSLRGKKCSRP
jgi:hypothetical protein